jgi:HAMP domain-containing protein
MPDVISAEEQSMTSPSLHKPPEPGLAERLRFRNWRIANKLLVVTLLLSLVPLLIISWISAEIRAQAVTSDTRINLSRLSHDVALRVSQAIVSDHREIQLAADNPDVIAFLRTSAPEQRAALQGHLNATIAYLTVAAPEVDSVGIYDATGTTVAHSAPALVGTNVSSRDFVRAALGGKTYTSGFRVDAVNGAAGISISTPVQDGSRTIGAIAMHIRGKYIENLLTQALNLEGGNASSDARQAIDIMLVDEHGIIMSDLTTPGRIFRSLGTPSEQALREISAESSLGGACPAGATTCAPEQKRPRLPRPIPGAQPLAEELQVSLQTGRSGSYRYCAPDSLDAPLTPGKCQGSWHVVGFAPEQTLPTDSAGAAPNLFLVAVDVPEAIFLQPVQQQRLQDYLITAAIGILAVLASLLVARSLSRPIRHLASTAQEVESDKPLASEQIGYVLALGDEIGHLARVFNSMVAALRKRMAELRAIYDIGHTISSSIDLDETLTFIIDSVRSVIPFDAAEICLYNEDQGQMVARVIAAEGPARKTNLAYAPAQYFIGRLVDQRAGLLIPEIDAAGVTSSQPERTWQPLGPHAYLGVPMLAGGAIIGTIELVSRQPAGFSQDNLRILESIAIQAAVAVQNAQEVQVREARFKEQIKAMSIEIDTFRREKEVSEIVENESFRKLRDRAASLRGARKDKAEPE